MADFIQAIHKKTGDTQRIPTHWLTHPVIGSDYEPLAAPSETAAQPTKKEKK